MNATMEPTGEVKADDEPKFPDGRKGYTCRRTLKDGRVHYGPPVENKFWKWETSCEPLAELVAMALAAKGYYASLEVVFPDGVTLHETLCIVRTSASKSVLERTAKKVVAEAKRLQAAS
jgi:hypothetical protein